MKLLTKKNRDDLPALYSTEEQGDEAMAIVKFFHPFSNVTLYALEFDGDDTFFGWIEGQTKELGYFTLHEMEGVKVHGLGMERDLYFTPISLGELRKKANV